ncbi:MAG: enhanced serine sensitivity protein SseB C-terminal domain-containing protein [Gammaproteobacteria bacterium]|nr:enhanced serine sensitivity protein SseB C-terminal domain-containing protein [Gammaproteobacteria bacterium]
MNPNQPPTLEACPPDPFPTALVNALSALFRRLPAVNQAYVVQCHVTGSTERPHMVIGISGADDLNDVIHRAGRVARYYLKRGDYVDFLRVEDSALEHYLLNESEPFYRRRLDA